MAKAIIVSVDLGTDGTYTVTYERSTRRWPQESLPGTVRTWLEANAPSLLDPVQARTEGLPMEEPAALAVIPAELPAMEAAPRMPGTCRRIFGAAIRAARASAPAIGKAVLMSARMGARMGARMAGAAASAAPAIGRAAIRAAYLGMDAWYWLTTYVPISARKAAFLMEWDVIPASARAGRAAGIMLAKAGIAAAGWLAAGLVLLVATAKAAVTAAVQGWRLRAEIISEG